MRSRSRATICVEATISVPARIAGLRACVSAPMPEKCRRRPSRQPATNRTIVFAAQLPSMGFSVYEVRPSPTPCSIQNPNLPGWVPQGVDLALVPPEVRQAITELIEPVYRQFVLAATDALEKSLGVTVTHLLWLEVLDQFDMKRQIRDDMVLRSKGNRHDAIAQHLRVIDAKVRVGYFLVRLQEFRSRLAEREKAQRAETAAAAAADPFGLAVANLMRAEPAAEPAIRPAAGDGKPLPPADTRNRGTWDWVSPGRLPIAAAPAVRRTGRRRAGR